MLSSLKKNVISKGLPVNKVIVVYRHLNFQKYIKLFYGLGVEFLKIFFLKFEIQWDKTKLTLLDIKISNNVLLKTLNIENLEILPPFRDISLYQSYTLIRHVLIRCYKGYRIMKLRPMYAQRTWSNAKTTRKINFKIRSFGKTFWRETGRLTIKQARKRIRNYTQKLKKKNKTKVKIKKKINRTKVFY